VACARASPRSGPSWPTPGTAAASWPATSCDEGWRLRIVHRRERAFRITGLTWIVERSVAWLGRNRRLSKDYEYKVQTSEALIDVAAIRLMLNRTAPA
jgi:putative transposase